MIVTITSPAVRDVKFFLIDNNGIIIGSLNHICPVGSSTAIITTAFAGVDIYVLYVAVPVGVEGLNDMLVTSIAVDGFTSTPTFWQNFHGQHEVE